ncbi:hypothetical protein VTL71DRAFT_2194 [Oculimacula yallundae]|uniref:Uncharacterized protein n=1 Tax=Oculimacula yallundae TaxID=86028 RepID=A0ABR4C876_9HELO
MSNPYLNPNPDPSNNFLFVNQSTNSPSYKVGYRPDVRSHIRKHVARGLNRRTEIQSYGEQLSLSPSGLYLENETQVRSNTGKARNTRTSEVVLCKTCGNRSSARASKGDEYNMLSEKSSNERWRALLQISPREMLGSGRFDPFSTSAGSEDAETNELLDLGVTYLIPGLMPDDHPNRSLSLTSTSSRTWIFASLSHPFLRNAILLACSLERAFLVHSTIDVSSPATIARKLLVIQTLNAFINSKQNTTHVCDEVLLTILILAAHEAVDFVAIEEPEENKPFNSPLTNMQWMNMYGNNTYQNVHMKALHGIVKGRGGLEELKLPCVAEMIVLGDIISSLNTFCKPVFAPIQIHEAYIASAMDWAKTSPHLPPQILATSFSRYAEYGISESLLEILEPLGVVTWAIDYHLQAKPVGLTIGEIGRTRAAVMKRLLFLPSAEELGFEKNFAVVGGTNFYECCRLTAFIYSVAVTFPIPNTRVVLRYYVGLLKAAIEDLEVESFEDGKVDEIMLWILMMGGIAALGKEEREWFVETLGILREKMEISWSEAIGIFEKFLWLNSACGAGGKRLWEDSEAWCLR